METLAPPVVAVVVAHDPGPWFEETLASLESQDYAELSVLVLDAAGAEDLKARVAAVLPRAYVRRLDENRGFGATVNEVMAMVDGADYFLLCHDDVALFPDAVHLLVEEAFRSNAGIVSPKVVSWDDAERLVHVGMAVDKGGSVVERVQPGEIDHGQHDAVRDVFVAPGGATLVRADLFEELGGFDTAIVAMGEDLDLCWRAQVVGARIIVAPDARVRHLEELAGGSRSIEPSLVGGDGEGGSTRPVTLQELQRRHELLAVFKCYGPFHLVRVVPQILVLAIGEVIVAELAGNRARARAVVRAWRWNLGRLGTIRRQRKQLKGNRRLGDKEIRLLQVAGSARLSAYGRRVFQLGFHGAHADELASAEGDAEPYAGAALAGAAVGATIDAPEPAGAADHATGAGAGALADGVPAGRSGRGRLSGRTRLTVWLGAALIVVIGSRGVIGARLPVVGQFVPFPSWSSTFGQFFAGWHPSGVGTTAPASPALALAGVVGTVLLGAMGLTQKVLVFACLPLGVWGVVRLLRTFGSQRASLVAGLSYLAMALPYNALALGRWGAMVVYAGAPWVLARLFRATGSAPYVVGPAPGRSGRGAGFRQMVALGLLEAVLVSFVPAAAVVVVVAALALLISSLAFGEWRAALRAVQLAVGSTVVAAVICLPWLIGVLSAGRGAVAVFGVPTPASEAASWDSLLRFAVGPIGVSPLAWGFAVAALVPLLLARGDRFRWAGRCWSIALVFWFVAWIVGRGWTGSLAIDPLVLLAPAAAALAAAIGLGIAAFEEDLWAADFGWRQLVTVVAAGAVVLGSIPTVLSAIPGRWDLPVNDFSQSVTWMKARAAGGAFRVLWLGDPRSLNQGSWSAGRGLAYATSEDGSPDARWLWNAPGPGPASRLASAVNLARSDRTDRLGTMLAPSGVRYVVLLTSLAPEISGEQTPQEYPVPADLAPGLARQLDLTPVVSGTGITVYANAAWIPERAQIGVGRPAVASRRHPPATATAAAPAAPAGSSPNAAIVAGVRPVLPGPAASTSYRGPLSVGTVLTASAPAGRWKLVQSDGSTAVRSPSFGWAGKYAVTEAGVGTLRFDGGLLAPLSLIGSVIVWLAAIAVVSGRGLGRSWRRISTGRRRPRGDPEEPAGGSATTAPAAEGVPDAGTAT
ncbi:MAG: glycosyltransferase family 2 protein [Acidimicrobiales bacterium]